MDEMYRQKERSIFFILTLICVFFTVSPVITQGADDNAGKIKVPKKGVVTATALHYRSAPTINSKSLGTNSKGTVLNLYGQKNGWYKISQSSAQYSSGRYIRVTEWGYEDSKTTLPQKTGGKQHPKVWSTLKTPHFPLLNAVGDQGLSKSSGR
ncbi:SH3 domain-containing protein [Candidatus Riflebacteria bacterium]